MGNCLKGGRTWQGLGSHLLITTFTPSLTPTTVLSPIHQPAMAALADPFSAAYTWHTKLPVCKRGSKVSLSSEEEEGGACVDHLNSVYCDSSDFANTSSDGGESEVDTDLVEDDEVVSGDADGPTLISGRPRSARQGARVKGWA